LSHQRPRSICLSQTHLHLGFSLVHSTILSNVLPFIVLIGGTSRWNSVFLRTPISLGTGRVGISAAELRCGVIRGGTFGDPSEETDRCFFSFDDNLLLSRALKFPAFNSPDDTFSGRKESRPSGLICVTGAWLGWSLVGLRSLTLMDPPSQSPVMWRNFRPFSRTTSCLTLHFPVSPAGELQKRMD